VNSSVAVHAMIDGAQLCMFVYMYVVVELTISPPCYAVDM